MEFTHKAIGKDPDAFVRVDVLWTPGREGVEMNVRDGQALVSQGIYRAPRLAVMPLDPDSDTLHSAVRLVLSQVRQQSWHTDYAYRLAQRNRLTWVPEKLAEKAP
jgi:hypothetical protein